jgi:hypothetical protein
MGRTTVNPAQNTCTRNPSLQRTPRTFLDSKKASLPLNGERLAIHRDRETFPTVGQPMTRVASQKLFKGLCLWFRSLHLLDSVL